MNNPVHIRSEGTSGKDVVFLHGFGADRLSWLATAPSLTNVRTHLVDLPGHGASGPEVGDGTVNELTETVLEALSNQEIKGPWHLVAHSLGAGIAMMMAAHRPDLVKSLFLIAPAGLGQGVNQQFLSTYPHVTDVQQMTKVLEGLVVNRNLISAQTVAYAIKSLAEPDRGKALQKIATGLNASDSALKEACETVAQTNLPRLVVWGDKDLINPLDLDRLNAFGAFHLVPDAGHLPHIEAALVVNRYLGTFLADTE